MRKVLAKSKIAKKEAAQSSKKPVSAAAAAAAATAKRRAIRARQASAQQQKEQRANAALKKNPNRRADTAAKADTSGSDLEPPFSYEIHHKNKTISVFVTLHKVPPATIDVESTTPSTLIVHTDKFTKKWRLVFPFPEGLLVENEKADYTYEGGVLKCVFPIKGNIPSTIVQQREKLFESFRSQKNLRFRTTQEGALVVRSRRATMSKARRPLGATQRSRRTRRTKGRHQQQQLQPCRKIQRPVSKSPLLLLRQQKSRRQKFQCQQRKSPPPMHLLSRSPQRRRRSQMVLP